MCAKRANGLQGMRRERFILDPGNFSSAVTRWLLIRIRPLSAIAQAVTDPRSPRRVCRNLVTLTSPSSVADSKRGETPARMLIILSYERFIHIQSLSFRVSGPEEFLP